MSEPLKVWAVKYEFQMGNGEWAEAYIVKRHLSDCHEIKFEKGERNIRIVELVEKPERCITVEMLRNETNRIRAQPEFSDARTREFYISALGLLDRQIAYLRGEREEI